MQQHVTTKRANCCFFDDVKAWAALSKYERDSGYMAASLPEIGFFILFLLHE